MFDLFQMEVIVGDFGIVVVPRDGADTEKILNHSSILRKYKVLRREPTMSSGPVLLSQDSKCSTFTDNMYF